MPTTTRESRALISFALATAFLLGGISDVAFALSSALVSVLANFLPANLNVVVGITIATAVLALAVAIHLVARSSTKDGPLDDVWHHLGVAASWISLLLVVMASVAFVGALGDNWPEPLFR